jgi:hypothetical protein
LPGYIKLYRKLLDNPIMKKPGMLQLWIYCLLKANHEPGRTHFGKDDINVLPGQFVTGRFELSSALGEKPSTIYKRISALQRSGFLNTKSNNKNTLVTVVNWELYQSADRESNNKSNNKVTTKEQQSSTNKNDKNDKKIYSDFVSMLPQEYQKLIDQFGESGAKERIEALNLWKGSKGKKTASDYLTILNWERRKKDEKPPTKSIANKGNFEQRQYSDDTIEGLYKDV